MILCCRLDFLNSQVPTDFKIFRFIDGLNAQLKTLYPLHQNSSECDSCLPSDVIHVYHRGDFDFQEFLPLFFTYLILFFYMYFSVRKIELVRSKVRLIFIENHLETIKYKSNEKEMPMEEAIINS